MALLIFAGVKSAVMQVEMASASALADCGMTQAEMAGMGGAMQADPFAPAAQKAPAPKPAKGQGELCGYCIDSAHAPLLAYAESLLPPSAVSFVPATARLPLGTRAPPELTPRARGPPSSPLFV